MDPIQITFRDTPEKLRPMAAEAAQSLTAILRELAALEAKCFAQYIRLCKKGRVIEFKDGERREFTDAQAWKAEETLRFAALLDPHCTGKLIAQRRECIHATHFPSSFHCVNTGCELIVTMKSANKAEAILLPGEDSVPYDLSSPDVRYLVEDMKDSGHSAQFYGYFQKFRFVLKREGEDWKIDEVFVSSRHEGRWRRDRNF